MAAFLPLLCWSHTGEPPAALFLRAWKAIHGHYTRPLGSSSHQWPMTGVQPLWLSQGGTLLHTAHKPGKQLRHSHCLRLSCYLFSPAVGYADEEQRLQAPGSPPWFRNGSFSGNLFCKSQLQTTSELHYQSFLIQDTDVDGAYDCHTLFLHSLWLLSCKAGWYSPSFLSFSWLHLTPSCVQFFCPHPLASSLLVSVSFLISRLVHLFPCATQSINFTTKLTFLWHPLQGLLPFPRWPGSLSCPSPAIPTCSPPAYILTSAQENNKESQELLTGYWATETTSQYDLMKSSPKFYSASAPHSVAKKMPWALMRHQLSGCFVRGTLVCLCLFSW